MFLYFSQNAMSFYQYHLQTIKQCIQSIQASKRDMLTFHPLAKAEAEPIAMCAITISVKVETMVMSTAPLGPIPTMWSSTGHLP